MSQLANQLNEVIEKTAKLIDLCATLQEENNALQLENQSLKQDNEVSKKNIAELEERLRVLKLARSLEGKNEGSENTDEKSLDIKQKINDFVREIDKCIVLLKK